MTSHSRLSPIRGTRLLLVMIVAVAGASGCHEQAAPRRTGAPVATAPAHTEDEIRDLDLAYFQERARRDPTGAMDLAHVASLHLARARATGDPRDAIAAEQAARQSLRNRGARNDQASQVLYASLLAQHRFAEALSIAKRLRDESPESSSLQAAVGEIQMELGQYDSARVSFAATHAPLGDLSVSPRLSRWMEIQGDPQRALVLQRAALAVALKAPGVPAEQIAWFWLRLGDIHVRMGQHASADSAYRSGLAAHAGDYRLLSALARSASIQERWQDAITYGEDGIAANLDPATLGTLSDAYAAIGDTAKSAEYARTLEVVVLQQPGAYHRAWSLFLVDHGRHLPLVTRKIREELKTRKDVYAYDLLAWALERAGRHEEAGVAMKIALSQGTKDPLLLHHARTIERSLASSGASGASASSGASGASGAGR